MIMEKCIKTIKSALDAGDLYVAVPWPQSQELMEEEGFRENSYLINDEIGLDHYGSSAYMVSMKWAVERNILAIE